MTERFAREVLRAAEHLSIEPRGREILRAAYGVAAGRAPLAELARVLERHHHVIVLPPARIRSALG